AHARRGAARLMLTRCSHAGPGPGPCVGSRISSAGIGEQAGAALALRPLRAGHAGIAQAVVGVLRVARVVRRALGRNVARVPARRPIVAGVAVAARRGAPAAVAGPIALLARRQLRVGARGAARRALLRLLAVALAVAVAVVAARAVRLALVLRRLHARRDGGAGPVRGARQGLGA